jgi:hypothetical protein
VLLMSEVMVVTDELKDKLEGEGLREHIEAFKSGEPEVMADDLSEILADVLHQHARSNEWRERLRSWPNSWRISTVVVLLLTCAAGVWTGWGRVDWAMFPTDRMVTQMVASALVLTLLVRLWSRPIHAPPLAPARVLFLISTACVTSVFFSILPPAHQNHPASVYGLHGGGFEVALLCLATGLLLSFPVLVVAVLFSRSSMRGREMRWAFILAGFAGFSLLHLHCPITLSDHLMLGHVSVFIVSFVFGFALCRR